LKLRNETFSITTALPERKNPSPEAGEGFGTAQLLVSGR
jgi:hypothetical protein